MPLSPDDQQNVLQMIQIETATTKARLHQLELTIFNRTQQTRIDERADLERDRLTRLGRLIDRTQRSLHELADLHAEAVERLNANYETPAVPIQD